MQFWLNAQDEGDLLSLLGEEATTEYATASFKTNRVVNGHSLENTAAGVLDFKISHRFFPFNSNFEGFWGLDNANIRLGLDYGITDRLMIGYGRSSKGEKTVDGYLKYKILRQSTGKRNMPLTLAYYADIQLRTTKFTVTDPPREYYFSNRLAYTHQLLVGRKFNDGFTLQLMPTLVHRNLVPTTEDKNDVLVMGVAGRIKLTKRVTINAEYYYVLPDQIVSTDYTNSLSLGFDIETGGHVFQLHVTNADLMNYKGFLTETTGKWFDGLRFGFNISRVFTIVKPKGLN